METIASVSFNGGQGKSTTALILGRILAEKYRVLFVDCEPQSSLTSWILGHYLDSDLMSLRDVLENNQPVDSCMFQLSENLYLLPSDESLLRAESYLASSGRSALILKQRLRAVADKFDYVIVDTPPEPIQLAMTTLGAANRVIVPATADLKGTQALARTIAVLSDFGRDMDMQIPIFGVVPFKVSMYGKNMFTECQQALQAITQIAEAHGIPVMPNVVRSDQFDRALSRQVTLQGLGAEFSYLELPFQIIAEKIVGQKAEKWRTNYIPTAATDKVEVAA